MADGGEDVPQGKKSLLIAIGAAVDKIISHFNGSRKLVQKAQLGDSRLNPSLGYLITEGLCPALAALLADGLKPFQKDVIIGRRSLSPWHLVEASTKTGSQSLQSLYSTISRLQQLRDPQRRFNAFIFGLLNTKQLEVWLAHLHHSYDQLSVFFLPSGFIPLAATSHPELREELLLTLQPLSALTFHTDLLFEHHHLPLQDPPTPQHPPTQSPTRAENWGVPTFQHILGLGSWLAHNLTSSGKTLSQSESCTTDVSSACSQHEGGTCSRVQEDTPQEADPTAAGGDWGRNWWGQLTQASSMYMTKELFTSTTCVNPGKEQRKPNPGGSEDAGILEEPSHTTANGRDSAADPKGGQLGSSQAHTSSAPEGKTGWFGPLFGESPRFRRELEGKAAGKSRRPSSWLQPNFNVLDLLRKQPTLEKDRSSPQTEGEAMHRPESRLLRALCDHSASGEDQLSFQKDDVLQLLGTLDDDWIHCRRGSLSGLVPVGYTSLIL